MKISHNIDRPLILITEFISYQLYLLEPLFRLSTQGRRITMLELKRLIIVGLHNMQNDIGNASSSVYVDHLDILSILILNNDVVANLFHYASSWNDVKSLMLVCQQFIHVGKNLSIDLPFYISSDFDFKKLAIPLTMAKVIFVICDISTKEAFFSRIKELFTSCGITGVNFNDLSDSVTIKKIYQSVLKKGITLNILGSHNLEKVSAITSKLTEKYDKKHEEYRMKQNGCISKRRRTDNECIMLQVPKSKQLRQRFLLEHLLKLSASITSNDNDKIENPFSTISHIDEYKATINVSKFFTCGVDEAFEQIQQFLNCVIEFKDFEILVTSFDIFYHNHRYDDDYAQLLSKIDQLPTARVSRKTYTNIQFTEISIFAGHYKLLVVGGYLHRHVSITPFLGSSVYKFQLDEETTTCIKVPCFFLALYKEKVAKDIALKIVKSGLKNEIQHQHKEIINKVKKDL